MILGKINGKTTTTRFSFLVESSEAKKFDYVQVLHEEYGYILCQIVEITRDSEKTIASCNILGYKDKSGRVKQIRTPFVPGSEVLLAQDKFISEVIKLDSAKEGAYIGLLDGKSIPVMLNLKKLLTKHIAVLAKTGAGKSYTSGVLLEEIIDKNVPLLIIDPHGEYSQMKNPNQNEDEIKEMPKFNIKPKGYIKHIVEYGNQELNPNVKPLKISSILSPRELLHMLPAKLTSTQKSIIYSALKNVDKVEFKELIYFVEQDESSSKFAVVNTLTYLMNLNIFSNNPTPLNEIIKPGKCSIINLKGYNPELQEIIVYKLLKDLFEKRKKGYVPPFFAVIEEAHNFCPERNFGEAKSSSILRTIASEGRKFGLGLAIISQRPARVDNNVLSQCNTQIILKVTNPSDLKAISKSVEGMTKEAEEEIRNLPIGTAMVTGLVDMPLFVNIRTRKSQHGGSSVNMFEELDEKELSDKRTPYSEETVLPLILPKIQKKDLRLMSNKHIKKIETYLIPAVLLFCNGKIEYKLLIERINGEIVINTDTFETVVLPDISRLTPNEINLLKECVNKGEFRIEDLKSPELLRVSNYINILLNKGYLIKAQREKFKVNPKIVLKDPSGYASYDEIQMTKVSYTKKLPEKLSVKDIKDRVSKFVKIESVRDCYLVHFRPTY
jgi:DNA helicase HerA-like ATPase